MVIEWLFFAEMTVPYLQRVRGPTLRGKRHLASSEQLLEIVEELP